MGVQTKHICCMCGGCERYIVPVQFGAQSNDGTLLSDVYMPDCFWCDVSLLLCLNISGSISLADHYHPHVSIPIPALASCEAACLLCVCRHVVLYSTPLCFVCGAHKLEMLPFQPTAPVIRMQSSSLYGALDRVHGIQWPCALTLQALCAVASPPACSTALVAARRQ